MKKKKSENQTLRFIQGKKTLGQNAADLLAKFAGSWTFIIGFVIFLAFWMYVNIQAYANAWDPYPFILLNLVLSTIAALQAPIILMAQNRQAEKDRAKAEYDYKVNRKSEREIQEVLKRLDKIEEGLEISKKVKQVRSRKKK